jgi:hypothetical protein
MVHPVRLVRRRPIIWRSRLRLELLEDRRAPAVLTPDLVRDAYGFDQISFDGVAGDGTGQTIAIVSAFDHPTIEADLAEFSQQFGLPAANFSEIELGAGQTDPGWALETALDVQWAHAIAPGASILLVEAASNSIGDMLDAVAVAASQPGVSAVSMSWGGPEFFGQWAFDDFFQKVGVTFVAASGDNGRVNWPAVSPNVLAVGGTMLPLGGGAETAWSGSGGGLSRFYAAPDYQAGLGLGRRATPDVAYNAAPRSGVAVFTSVGPEGDGWYQVGGTSAGAPQWAALVAIANQGRALLGLPALDGASETLPALYGQSAENFNDVTVGRDAGPGFDLATGLGTPEAEQVVADLVGEPEGPVAETPPPAEDAPPAEEEPPAEPPAGPQPVEPEPAEPPRAPPRPGETMGPSVVVVPAAPASRVDFSVGAGRVILRTEGPAAAGSGLVPVVTVVAPTATPVLPPMPRFLSVRVAEAETQPDEVPAEQPAAPVPAAPAAPREQTPPADEERREPPTPPQSPDRKDEKQEPDAAPAVEVVIGDYAPIRVAEDAPVVVEEPALAGDLAALLGVGVVLTAAGRTGAEKQAMGRGLRTRT